MATKKLPPEVLEFFKKEGAKGGKKRAKKYSAEQLSEWAKKGGRPRKQSTPKRKSTGKE